MCIRDSNKAMGGSDTDVGGRVVAQLNDLVESVRGLGAAGKPASEAPGIPWEQLLAGLDSLGKLRPQVEVVAPPQPGTQKLLESLADSLENSFLPLIRAMDCLLYTSRCV